MNTIELLFVQYELEIGPKPQILLYGLLEFKIRLIMIDQTELASSSWSSLSPYPLNMGDQYQTIIIIL